MPILNLGSPTFDPYDSYGRIASELASYALQQGWHVNGLAGDSPYRHIRPATGGIVLGYPTNADNYGALLNSGSRIIVTMFESTVLPDGWVEQLNTYAAVVVPAHFLVAVFQDNGVTAPIHVIPLGVSAVFQDCQPRSRPAAGQPLRFLGIADRGYRKGWQRVVQAFNAAFGDDPACELILKARQLPFQITNPNIHIIAEDYTPEQLRDLYHACQVMVFPTHGEGFGLPPREFAATGGIALATDWGGTADGLAQWGIPLPTTLIPAWQYTPEWAGTLGQWAAIEQDVLKSQLRHIADHFEHFISTGVQAAGYVHSHYRWSSFSEQVLKLYCEVHHARQ